MAKSKKKRSYVPFFLLVILPLLAMGISFFAIFKGVQDYITTSDYFRIRELKSQGIADQRYLDLIKEEIVGDNIFQVDATKLADRIKNRFPTFYGVAVARVLPSQLLIIAKERKPVALLKRDLYYLLDQEGVVLSSFASPGQTDFPLISGLEARLSKVRVGETYSVDVLRKSLLLATALRSQIPPIEVILSPTDKLRVTRIDATDPGNLCFYIGESIQVKIGDRDFDSRLDLLPAILRSIGTDLSNLKYIDLRLKEPVVATKNNKSKKK